MSTQYNIADFGAMDDGQSLCTEAVQLAIDTCSRNGGGTVVVPTGRHFIIGTIYIRDNVTLHIEENAFLEGSCFLKDYATDTGRSPYYPEMLDRCLIYAHKAHGIAITGRGTIDGRYDPDTFTRPVEATGREARQRPMLVRLEECDDIHIENIKFTGSCSWCVHLKYSNNIRISNVFIDNRRQDGFNIESCSDVTIANCSLICGDDGIALTTSHKDKPIKNLTVTNCIITTRWAAIRMGPLSKGNFENITVSNCVFHECNGGGIKLGMFEGAEIRNCTFSNLVMDRCCVPVAMFIDQWTDIGETSGQQGLMPVGGIHDLMFSNIRAIAYNYPVLENCQAKWTMDKWRSHPDLNFTIFLHGHPEADIKNIHFDNVSVSFEGGGTAEMAERRDIVDMDDFGPEECGYWTDGKSCWGTVPSYGIYARHIDGLQMNQVKFDLENTDMRPPIFCRDCLNLNFNRLDAECTDGESVVVAYDCKDLSVTQYMGSEDHLIQGEGNCTNLYSNYLVPRKTA